MSIQQSCQLFVETVVIQYPFVCQISVCDETLNQHFQSVVKITHYKTGLHQIYMIFIKSFHGWDLHLNPPNCIINPENIDLLAL